MNQLEPQKVYHLLREIRSVAMEASMTGSLRKGARVLVDVYNRCLASVAHSDPLVGDLFPKLNPDSASIDEVGAAAALLSRYIAPADVGKRRYEHDDDHDEEDEEDD